MNELLNNNYKKYRHERSYNCLNSTQNVLKLLKIVQNNTQKTPNEKKLIKEIPQKNKFHTNFIISYSVQNLNNVNQLTNHNQNQNQNQSNLHEQLKLPFKLKKQHTHQLLKIGLELPPIDTKRKQLFPFESPKLTNIQINKTKIQSSILDEDIQNNFLFHKQKNQITRKRRVQTQIEYRDQKFSKTKLKNKNRRKFQFNITHQLSKQIQNSNKYEGWRKQPDYQLFSKNWQFTIDDALHKQS